MKNTEIEKKVKEIDLEVKEIGVDLEKKIALKEKAIRRMFRGLDLYTQVVGGEIFLIKNRMQGVIH
jgi:hypothetical protein